MPPIRKDPIHWAIVVILIVSGIFVGKRLDEKSAWIRIRYRIYDYLQRFDRVVIDVERTRLVFIEDDEYWKGELARRVPIKRDYLAKLLRALDRADPAMIVLDFDFRSPAPDGSLRDHHDYKAETERFIQAVRDVSQNRPVVLPRTIGFDRNKKYVVEPAIYDQYDLTGGRVVFGYIELPYDLRQVPLPIQIKGKADLHSLSSAVVQIENPEALRRASTGKNTLPYGSFANRDLFPQVSSSYALKAGPRELNEKLGHKIVIIGAGWSRYAFGRGGIVDATTSPIGTVGKVFLHANYIEALLDQRTYRPLNKKVVIAIEVLFSLAIALVLAMKVRLLIKLLGFAVIYLLILVITYLFWKNLGVFFDFFILLVLLVGHAIVEHMMKWLKLARKYESLREEMKARELSGGSP